MKRPFARVALLVYTFALFIPSLYAMDIKPRVINGTVVTSGFKEVVLVDNSVFKCTASFVGPRVVLTAGSCIDSSDGRATVKLTVNGQQVNADFYASQTAQHDLAVAIVTQDVAGINPMTVGGAAKVNDLVTMLGYGCHTELGKPSDGLLRSGETQVKTIDGLIFSTNKSGGAQVCFWDVGGPVYLSGDINHTILGVSSRSDTSKTSYITRTDSAASQDFLNNIATTKGVKICGIQSTDCGAILPPKPTCALAASASSIKQGEPLTVSMTTTGSVDTATIDGTTITFPPGNKVFTPAAAGNFTAQGTVKGPGGTSTCSIAYQVTPPAVDPAPSCTLTANPPEVSIGAPVILSLATQGTVTAATIEGSSAKFPNDTKVVTTTAAGTITAKATVTGPGGNGFCQATYKVNNGTATKPVCTLSAAPTEVVVGDNVTLRMSSMGVVTSATLEGGAATFPEMTKVVTTNTVGIYTAQGSVTGPGGTSTCRASYNVKDSPTTKPSCVLTATPNEIEIGKSLMLNVTTKGNVTAATIEGSSVSIPNGQKSVRPTAIGTFTAGATVTGPTGNNVCQTTYRVNSGPSPDKPSCDLTVSPPTINLGSDALMTLRTHGNVTVALLDGAYVSFPLYKKIKTPTAVGALPIYGSAEGPSGTGTCQATLDVLP